MYMHKVTPPINFHYPTSTNELSQKFCFAFQHLGNGIFKWEAVSHRWPENERNEPLHEPKLKSSNASDFPADWSQDKGLKIQISETFSLTSLPHKAFGFCGPKWILNFKYQEDLHFYGMGEKNNGFEKTSLQTKFWNTDVWADFGLHPVKYGITDPMYAGIPYLLITHKTGCIGILMNNPYDVFMILGAKEKIGQQKESQEQEPFQFAIGSGNGAPCLYFLCGKTVDEVTCKLQKLIGTTPRPPLWALGNHQCRWGYKSLDDLEELDRQFTAHQIPCDGLWLDIDYMDQFKVFTTDPDSFQNMAERINALHRSGRKIVPILDPGVKREDGYSVYDSGLQNDVFCKTQEGDIYTGYVWPGRTAFPDFSREQVQDWWAQQVEAFTQHGFDGYWLDMNDPSTGSAELEDMRFQNGEKDHTFYHNRYALGMQQATRKGLLAQHPNQRTFLLSRSGAIGTSQYSALWTGDNYANEHNMRKAVEISLNLSLSGIAFSGPDLPGFGGKPDAELAELWYKQGFLFPFFRNHSCEGYAPREPWRFPSQTQRILSRYIRLRYKLIPYLYNLFIQQEKTGHPIIRPIFYDATEELNRFCRTDDQFMIGPNIMQAPISKKGSSQRTVLLPEGDWFCAMTGQWIHGERSKTHTATADKNATPLYLRDGAIIPMLPGERTTPEKNLCDIELHLFIQPGQSSHWEYEADDGDSFNYQQGIRTYIEAQITADAEHLTITLNTIENGYQPISIRPVCYHPFKQVIVRTSALNIALATESMQITLTGKPLQAFRTPAIEIDSPNRIEKSQ